MKRVLIITYYWPPSGGSGVQRWLKFTKYLPQYDWQPVIYTPSNPESTLIDNTLAEEIPPQAEILKRRILEPYSIFRLFSKGGKKKEGSASSSTAVNPINAVGEKSFMMKVSLWIRANIFVPDPRCLWIRPSVTFLRKYLKNHPVDAIVTTGPPHSMHLIGLHLHKATGIRWVADFRDPWTRIFYFKHLPMTGAVRNRHMRLEKKVLRNADAVVSVTDLITRQLESISTRNTAGPSCFHTIENGYDEEDFLNRTAPDSSFAITHTGVFSAEGNPERLWEVLGGLCRDEAGFRNDLKIVLAGKTDTEIIRNLEAAGLGDRIVNHGYVRHSESNALQQQARVLLLPLRKEPEANGILTGKYFEYLAAGRPIVAFGPHGGALDASLAKTGAGRIFDWDEYESLRSHILCMYRAYKDKREIPGFNPDQKEISGYSRKSLAGRIASLLDSHDNPRNSSRTLTTPLLPVRD